MEALLHMGHIGKRFGSFWADRDISLDVYGGEVLTLLGENGAGKSTLMDILIGLYQPTEGTISVDGREVRISSPSQAAALGIGMVHQHFMLVEAMTVLENIILGDRRSKGIFIDREARRAEIRELSERYGLEVDLDRGIRELSVGEQQRVEILKALWHGARILILDEPSAVLTDMEVEGLFAIMRRLTGEGRAVLFISHKMREVLRISDRIAVLRAGELVKVVRRAETSGPELSALMIGRDLAPSRYEKKTGRVPVLRLDHVRWDSASRHGGLDDVSLEVRRGEIVGVAGVDGNGQAQLAQMAAGGIAPEEGSVELDGETVAVFDPSGFIAKGVAHVPEDRILQGLVGEMSVSENLALKSIGSPAFSRFGGLSLRRRAIRDHGRRMAERYDIRCASTDQDVRSLSGGNQQKVILARELESDPSLLVAAHPTRGLDIGAARFIHDQMIDARERGVGILLISADLDEILEMSDRIVVLFEGRIMGEFTGIDPDVDRIGAAMTGERVRGGGRPGLGGPRPRRRKEVRHG